jgi:hypothetical protein
MIKKIKIICAECSKEHLKYKSDYLRKIKKGQSNFYCSNRCSSTANYRKNPKNLDKNKGNISFLKESGYCQLDEYSPFKYHASKAKARSKARRKKFDINIKYLKKIWDNQKGICPYTGIKMEISRTSQDEDIKKTPTKASLDRIDPNKGYVIGNVEFVCYCINVAKNDFSKEEMIDFINNIKKYT